MGGGGGGGSMSPGRLPAAAEASSLEDANFKSARITVEERREKIHRYIKKRNERNFSKKIKVTPSCMHAPLLSVSKFDCGHGCC